MDIFVAIVRIGVEQGTVLVMHEISSNIRCIFIILIGQAFNCSLPIFSVLFRSIPMYHCYLRPLGTT